MQRHMSLEDMLNSLAFVVAKSRVIDWAMIDSGNYIYSLGEVRNHLGTDLVEKWLSHRRRRDFQTIEQALKLFFDIQRYLLDERDGLHKALDASYRHIEADYWKI